VVAAVAKWWREREAEGNENEVAKFCQGNVSSIAVGYLLLLGALSCPGHGCEWGWWDECAEFCQGNVSSAAAWSFKLLG